MVNAIGNTNELTDKAKQDSYLDKVVKVNATKSKKRTEEDKVRFKEFADDLKVLKDDMASHNISTAFQNAYDGTANLLAIDPNVTGTMLDRMA